MRVYFIFNTNGPDHKLDTIKFCNRRLKFLIFWKSKLGFNTERGKVYFLFNSRDVARTQSHSHKLCARVSSFVEIANVNQLLVQWVDLNWIVRGFWSSIQLRQVSMICSAVKLLFKHIHNGFLVYRMQLHIGRVARFKSSKVA